MPGGLVDHLQTWSAEQVATLLARRPDLVRPQPPPDVAELAQRAQQRPSLDLAIDAASLPENRLLQVLVCCRPDAPLGEVASALPDGITLDDVEPVLAALEEAALVWRGDARVHLPNTLRLAMPTTLGPPLRLLVADQTVDYHRSAIKALRATLRQGGFGGSVPERATGPGGRPARKAELVDELEALLTAPGVVATVVAAAPPASAELASTLGEGPAYVELDSYLYFSSYGPARYRRELAPFWLFERALLLPFRDDLAAQPREVGVALRGGRPVPDLALEPPALAITTAVPEQVDAEAAARAVLTLDRLSDLLGRWGESPAQMLKSGGLGTRAMKQTATDLEIDLDEAFRVVELAHLAGLVETTTEWRREKRRDVRESSAGPSAAAPSWMGRPLAERWRQLAVAWLRADHWLSVAGIKGGDGKVIPALGVQYATSAPDLRRRVLERLADLGPGEATTGEALAASVYWTAPQPWLGLGLGGDGPATIIGWVQAEAELLGVMAHGSLSSFGRALVAGTHRQAEQALEAARPEPVTTFTLQADLTATVVGALERELALELRLLADIESTGAATTLRFSGASLRRALDAGRDGDAIMGFLEAHAAKGVPKALAYLVADVVRRHGHLQVGTAGSFVTSEDPAVLADACSHRRTRKLSLRLLAPTVAVSAKPANAVIEGLRAAGFLPTGGADGDAGPVSIGAPRTGTAPSQGDGAGSGVPLAEPYRTRRSTSVLPQLDPEKAAALARAILDGPPPGAPSTSTPLAEAEAMIASLFDGADDHAEHDVADVDALETLSRLAEAEARANGFDDDLFPDDGFDDDLDDDDLDDDDLLEFIDDAPGAIEELFQQAADEQRVLALVMADDETAAPVIVAVTSVGPRGLAGMNLETGGPMIVPVAKVGAAMDLGPTKELANVTPLSPSRPRQRQRRGRR